MRRKIMMLAGSLLMIAAAIAIMPGMVVTVSAMPPHPNLLKQQQAGQKVLPDFAMRSRAEKESMGLDSPSPILTVSKAAITGNLKALVVLVEFPDHAASSNPEIFGHSSIVLQIGKAERRSWSEPLFRSRTMPARCTR